MVVTTIDDMEGKRTYDEGIRQWLRLHKLDVDNWLDTNVKHDDRETFLKQVTEGRNQKLRFITYMVVKQSQLSNQSKIKHIIKSLTDESGKLFIIVGAKRSGKTTLLYTIGEMLAKQGEEVWWYGPPTRLPPFIKGQSMNINKIPPNTQVLLDEAGMQFFSRVRDQTTTDFVRKLPILAHGSKNMIISTQATSIADITFFRLADAVLYKTYSVFQDESQREKISNELQRFMPNDKNECLYFDNQHILSFTYNLPEWWDDIYSKPYAPFKTKAEYYRFMLLLLKDLKDTLDQKTLVKKIVEQIAMKGKTISDVDVLLIKMLAEHYHYDTLLNNGDKMMCQLLDEGFDDTPISLQVQNKFLKLKGNFEFTPIEEAEALKWLEEDPIRKQYSMLNLNTRFVNDIKFRELHGQNYVVSIFGHTGSGKSYGSIDLAIAIAFVYKKKFNPINIEFLKDNVLDIVKKVGKRNTIIKDEDPTEFGPGSGRAMEELRNLEETIRKRQINIIFNSPRLHPHTHHFILKTFGIDRKQNLLRCLVFTETERGNRILHGYITLGLPPKAITDVYENKKDKFLKSIEERTMDSRYHEKIARKLKKDEKYMELKTQEARLGYIIYHHKITEMEAKIIRGMISWLS